jgi:predicted permease
MINPVDAPVRLDLPFDGRVLAFTALLILLVTTLFGLTPALQASAITPAATLKGGSHPLSRQRLMHGLIAVQVAFCVMVLLVAGLFVSTFRRLSNRPMGFSSARVITLESVTPAPKDASLWYQVADHLRSLSGVEDAAVAGWALMSGTGWNGSVWANGHSPETDKDVPWFLGVSPAWFETMKIPLLDGRPFNRTDTFPGVAIVNETFARRYFEGQNPIGRTLDTNVERKRVTVQIVGIAGDARYTGLRRNIPATVYVPFQGLNADGSAHPPERATFIVRTKAAAPLSLASQLRQEVRRAQPDFRVAAIRTQDELIHAQSIRERLLSTLSIFFGAVALGLAGVGLYGVLNYAVIQRRHELGIRAALGARVWELARRVSVPLLTMVVTGTVVGLALGIATARYVSSLLFMVRATDLSMLIWPCMAMIAASFIASLQPIMRAIHIQPASLLRME